MIKLKNHPDIMVAQNVALTYREIVNSLTVEVNCSGIRSIERAIRCKRVLCEPL